MVLLDFRKILGLPLGLSRNNPGNIIYVKANNWQGQVPISQQYPAHRFTQFTSVQYGIRAMFLNIKAHLARLPVNNQDISHLIAGPLLNGVMGWSATDTDSYIQYLSHELKMSATDRLCFSKSDEMKQLVWYMICFENGVSATNKVLTKSVINESWDMLSYVQLYTPIEDVSGQKSPLIYFVGLFLAFLFFYSMSSKKSH